MKLFFECGFVVFLWWLVYRMGEEFFDESLSGGDYVLLCIPAFVILLIALVGTGLVIEDIRHKRAVKEKFQKDLEVWKNR